VGDPARGRQRFRRYVEETWLPNHVMEASTRESYTYSIYKHLMPEFGEMRMIEILPEQVRAWITKLKNRGMTPVCAGPSNARDIPRRSGLAHPARRGYDR
jgi:hypothetical protein